jgi:putative phage-type endonuclease
MIKTYKTREEWLEARSEGIGGSDASCIVELNPYKSREQLLKEKVTLKRKKVRDNDAMDFGRRMEKPMVSVFEALIRAKSITPNDLSVYVHPKHEVLRYTPDATYVTEENKIGVLEVKTTTITPHNPITDWQGTVPRHYLTQVFHGLLVNPEWQEASIICFINRMDDFGAFSEVRLGHFPREEVEEHLKHLLEEELEFWKEVEDGRKAS